MSNGKHGKDAYFSLEDSAGSTLRNISQYVTNVTFSRSNDNHDTSTYGDEGHTFINGLTNGTITVDGLFDVTASTGSMTVLDSLVGLDGMTAGFEWGPLGNTPTSNPKYSGECILTSLDHSAPVADIITFSATLQITGDVTKSTFA
ncbi:MAG: hypothetical protein M3N43_06460 [Actinomycetota bacterium]|nr:hypothetical protein [Actinomycetota bacterium]